jgi:hypothetical protein
MNGAALRSSDKTVTLRSNPLLSKQTFQCNGFPAICQMVYQPDFICFFDQGF